MSYAHTAAADRLAALALNSVIAMAEIARDPNVPWSVRFRAHREIVARAFEAHDVRILGEDIAAIRRHLEAQQVAQEAQQQGLRLAYGGAR